MNVSPMGASGLITDVSNGGVYSNHVFGFELYSSDKDKDPFKVIHCTIRS